MLRHGHPEVLKISNMCRRQAILMPFCRLDSTHLTTKWTKWTRLTFGVTRWIRWTLQTYKLPNFLRRHKLKFLRPEKSYQFAIECRCLGWSSFVEKTCRIRFTRVTKGTKVCRSPGVWRRHSLDPENSQVSEFGMFSKGKFQAEKDEWTQDLLSTKTFIKPCEFFFCQLFFCLADGYRLANHISYYQDNAMTMPETVLNVPKNACDLSLQMENSCNNVSYVNLKRSTKFGRKAWRILKSWRQVHKDTWPMSQCLDV